MKGLIIFALLILTIIAIITIVMCVRDLIKIILYRNRIYLIINTLVESPLPAGIINKILPDSLNRIPDERIQILNYVFHGTANENIWHKRTNKKNNKRAFQFFKTSSQGLLSNEYFIKSTHRLLGSSIFEFTDQNIICKKEFWTNLYLNGDEYIYWPKFFFEDREFILSIYASCTQYENRNVPLFIYLSNSLKRDKEFVKNLLREKTAFYNYEIISENIPNNLKNTSFFKEIIDEIDSEILEYAPKELKLDEDFELIKSHYSKNKEVIHYASPSIKADRKYMIELSKIDNYCLNYLDKSIRFDFEFYSECLQNEIRILKYLSKEIPEYEKLAIAAISLSVSEVQYIPSELLNSNDFIVRALSEDISLFTVFYEKLESEFSSYLFFITAEGIPVSITPKEFQASVINILKKSTIPITNFVDLFKSLRIKSDKFNMVNYTLITEREILINIQRNFELLLTNILSRSEQEKNKIDLVFQIRDFLKTYHPKRNLSLLLFYCFLIIEKNTRYAGGLGQI
jgi:hypothetical protein